MAENPEIKARITSLNESRRFITDCLIAVGSPKSHAEVMANLLSEADYRGHYSHGMNRLDNYVRDIQNGLCDSKALPKIIKETTSTAWVDGQNGLGAVVGNFCMDLAIKKAKTSGVGWVVAKASNHYGIAAMYSLQATKEGMVGLCFSNTSPLLCPTRAKTAALGTNPLCISAPGQNNDSFVLDMATTAVEAGKLEVYKKRQQPLPEGWALNANGQVETDPETAIKACRLMPLGGSEITGGYKGSALSMLVEIFCGISSGSHYGPNVRKWGDASRPADLGQCFAAVDPNCFAPGFQGRLSDLMNSIRKMAPADPNKPVLMCGDPERAHMAEIDEAGGVQYVEELYRTCERLANELNVRPLISK